MMIVVIGTSHKTSPLWVREKAALSAVSLFDARKRMAAAAGLSGLLALSTCNRVEFYASLPEPCSSLDAVKAFLCAEYGLRPDDLSGFFYVKEGREAVTHFFGVAAGVDSMVLGESQVLGQVRQAVDLASQEGLLDSELSRLSARAELVAERIRRETCFCAHPVSVGSVAVEMAREFLGSLKNRTAMILGAGEMGIVTARALSANGVGSLMVANRTLSRAQEVAHHLGGRAVDYTELESQIAKVDILVASTSAPHVLLKKSMIRNIMESRLKRPLFIVDLSVPRNVDPQADELEKVTLVNVDGLQKTAEKNSQQRISELERVKDIIEAEADQMLASRDRKKMSLFELALG